MKKKLVKRISGFAAALMLAGTFVAVGNSTQAYASSRYRVGNADCIDENTVHPSKFNYLFMKMRVVANGGLNVRRGPGTQYNKIGSVSQGEIVVEAANDWGWAYIKYNTPNGYKVGWVTDKYLDDAD